MTDELGTPRPTVGCDLGALEQTPASFITADVGDQKISLIAPPLSTCTPRSKRLAVALESQTVPAVSGPKLEFERAVFQIDKAAGRRPGVTVHRQPATLELSLTGLAAGPHPLTVTVYYAKPARGGRRKAPTRVTKTVLTKFTVC